MENESGEEDTDWGNSTKKVPTKEREENLSGLVTSVVSVTNDWIDIILEGNKLKKKLILNVKNSKNSEYYDNEVFEYDVKQTREKFY